MQFVSCYRTWLIKGAVAVLVLTAGLTVRAQTDDDALRALTQQFFDAYLARDPDALQALWSVNAPDRDKFMRQFRQQLKDGEGFALGPLNVPEVKIDGDKATLRVALTVNANDAQTKRPLFGFGAWQRTLRFARENGAWRVWQCVVSEQELAVQLAAATTEAAQDTLLAQSPELVTPDLRRALVLLTRQQRNAGNFGRAMGVADLLERLAQRTGDELWLARAWQVRGSVYASLRENTQAAEWFHRSAQICEKLNDEEGLAGLWLNLGLLHVLQTEAAQGDEYYRKCAILAEKVGDKLMLARVLNNMGAGLIAKLLDNQPAGKVGMWNYPGRLQATPAALQEAVAYHQKVARLYDEANDPLGAPLMNLRIGAAYYLSGFDEKALAYYQLALTQFEALNAKARLPEALEPISQVYLKQGRYAEALATIERALQVRAETSAPGEFSGELIAAGKIYYALKRYDDAKRVWQEAVNTFEKQRNTVAGNTEARQLFFTSRLGPYQHLAGLKAEQGQAEEALRYAEMIKGRVLFDVIHTGAVVAENFLTAAERARLQQLKDNLNALSRQFNQTRVNPQPQPEAVRAAETKLNQARVEYETFRATLYSAHPELRLRHGDTPLLSLDDMGALVPDADTAVLEYAVLDEKCLLFVLTRQPGAGQVNLQVYRVPVNRWDLAAQLQRFQRQVRGDEKSKDANYDIGYKKTARALDTLLVQPARAQIAGRRKLIIVPEDVLWELPFQALVGPSGKHLLEEAEISYAPSLSVLREMMARRDASNAAAPTDKRRRLLALGNPVVGPETVARVSAGNLLALGNPVVGPETVARVSAGNRDAPLEPLPEAETEVAALRRLYGPAQSLVAIQGEARESLFKAEAGRYRVLHLATHAFADNARPMYSALVLAQSGDAQEDGLLEAWEIAQMRLNADLVVLSACRTARGRIGPGEGMMGLSWAFFLAGAPATVVSQWSVKSGDTAQLMIEFHRQLTGRAPVSTAEAMRRAARTLLRRPATNHPFHWAGFVVVGDGR